MPEKIDPELRAGAVRLVTEHEREYPSPTAAAAAAGKQLGLGRETVRRWVVQAQVDGGDREGMTTAEREEIRRLKAENARLREDVAILKAATTFFVSIPSGEVR
jgi:transposase-like protein